MNSENLVRFQMYISHLIMSYLLYQM